jgi:signal transduction histidine kinase
MIVVRSALDRGDIDAAGQTLDQATQTLTTATAELRDLARGIHPAMLSDKGLRPALQALADRAPFPVVFDCHVGERLPEEVEIAAFYFVAESLTNVARYANAESASIIVTQGQDHVLVAVADDGDGGAAVESGSGLRGLCDRIEALGGTIEIRSDPNQGTRIIADIPCRKHHLAGAASA